MRLILTGEVLAIDRVFDDWSGIGTRHNTLGLTVPMPRYTLTADIAIPTIRNTAPLHRTV